MARIRSIKPSFFQSDDVSVLPMRARLTWIGLWTHCDDQGRAKDNLRLIKAAIWPLDDVTLKDIEEDLETLAAEGRIVRYGFNGGRYLAVTNWSDHQHPQKATKSRLPAPPNGPAPAEQCASEPRGTGRVQDYVTTTGGLPEDSRRAIASRGGESSGGEGTHAPARNDPPSANSPTLPAGPKPPQKCPDHQNDPNPPPCGACADARKTRFEWERGRAEAESRQRSASAREQAETKRMAIAACRDCDGDGYLNGALCNHDPSTAVSTSRGAAYARDLLSGKATPS